MKKYFFKDSKIDLNKFSNSINKKGAFFGLMAGLITGVIKMILGFVYLDPLCGEEDHRPAIIKNVFIFSIYLKSSRI